MLLTVSVEPSAAFAVPILSTTRSPGAISAATKNDIYSNILGNAMHRRRITGVGDA